MVGEYGAVNAGYQSFQDVHQDIQSETKDQFCKFMTVFDKFTTIFGNIKPTLFGKLYKLNLIYVKLNWTGIYIFSKNQSLQIFHVPRKDSVNILKRARQVKSYFN